MSSSAATRHLSTVAVVARREVSAYFHAPIAYVVAVFFMLLQGFSFWAVVDVLADPGRPAPIGAVLRRHFGGSLLHWSMLIVVVAVISMRLVAEDKRQGTWEGLLTAPVAEGPVICGKWLGGAVFFALLWLPTLAYPVILHLYAPPGASIDIGPMLSAYLGILCIGLALVAVGVAASAATGNQIIAAVITFVVAMLLLLIGELAHADRSWLDRHPDMRAVIAHIDMRAHMDDLARGLLSSAVLVFYATVVASGLAAATLAAAWGRRRDLEARGVAVLLLAIICVCLNVLGARHAVSWDLSAARTNSLDPRTERVLAAAGSAYAEDRQAVDILVVRAGLDIFADVQGEIDRLLERLVRAQPALHLTRLDPALESDRIAALAGEFAVAGDNLRDGGVVVFQRGRRRRAVDLMDMASFAEDDLGVGKLARFRAEEAFATAIHEILDPDRPTICHSGGHGEMPPGEPASPGRSSPATGTELGVMDWSNIARTLERDGARLEEVTTLVGEVPGHCRVLVIMAPLRPLSPAEAAAVAAYLDRGGRLFVALSETFAATGLELILADYGIGLPRAVVVDPVAAAAGPAQWFTTDGYGDHPITSFFAGRRATVWLSPRAVVAQESATGEAAGAVTTRALVMSSAEGWGETDLDALALGQVGRDDRDIAGPVAVAAAASAPASGARVVVFGGARSLTAGIADSHTRGNQLLATSAIAWLSGRTQLVEVGAKTPEQVRLIMTRAELRATFVSCVILLPGLIAAIGGVIWWRRRRA